MVYLISLRMFSIKVTCARPFYFIFTVLPFELKYMLREMLQGYENILLHTIILAFIGKFWLHFHFSLSPWCWERLKAEKEDDRGWDGWMASPTWWTWVWASFRSWRWTGKPCVQQSMVSQRVRHDWATELNWIFSDRNHKSMTIFSSSLSLMKPSGFPLEFFNLQHYDLKVRNL